eukprot:TRINITY_DN4125_c0_g1_i4.p2 TRINITY_DN4125_c0_g1~~TRINITY_DN4125_c0_g1_i4.p2  ORF type:complete len:109 (-),score=16.60 TRINITY_DN4125_c0_g1_i4:1615-1941(-)
MHRRLDTVLVLGLLASLVAADVFQPLRTGSGGRWKREEIPQDSLSVSSSTEDDNLPPEDLPTGPSLGEILGTMTIVITIIYIFGISWKVLKIYRGEYEPQEPVYLKYK